MIIVMTMKKERKKETSTYSLDTSTYSLDTSTYLIDTSTYSKFY